MAYIATAYIAMAYICMAHIGHNYLDMASKMKYHTLATLHSRVSTLVLRHSPKGAASRTSESAAQTKTATESPRATCSTTTMTQGSINL